MRLTVLILALWNILRLGATLANWSVLAEFAPRPGPLYIALTASFWSLACIAAAESIRRRMVHAQGWYALTLTAYAAWWWADRYYLSGAPQTNGLFAAVVTAILLLHAAGVCFDGRIKAYFIQRESYDQPPSHPQPS